jgi:hypothetical protein
MRRQKLSALNVFDFGHFTVASHQTVPHKRASADVGLNLMNIHDCTAFQRKNEPHQMARLSTSKKKSSNEWFIQIYSVLE